MKILKFIILFLLTFIFSSCSAKYKIIKNYDTKNLNKICFQLCQKNKEQCEVSCRKKYGLCVDEANVKTEMFYKIAMENYKKLLNLYEMKLKAYKDNVYLYNSDVVKRDCFVKVYDENLKKNRYMIQKIYGLYPQRHLEAPIEPKMPNMTEILKETRSKCFLECGCEKDFDICFNACGGKIIYQKECIENCDN